MKCNAMSTYYSTSHTSCIGEKDSPGVAAKKSRMRMKVPTTTLIRFINLPSLDFPGKIKSDIF
jgi:hypothetical protein